MTKPAPYCVSFHDRLSGTCEHELTDGTYARQLFESLKEWPSVADAQMWSGGKMIGEWKRDDIR